MLAGTGTSNSNTATSFSLVSGFHWGCGVTATTPRTVPLPVSGSTALPMMSANRSVRAASRFPSQSSTQWAAVST